MTSFALAWRTAQRYRARTLLAIAGVAVIGALLFDMLLLSRGLLLSFADLLSSAGYDLRVVSNDGLGSRQPIAFSARFAEDVRRLPDVQAVTAIRLENASFRASGEPTGRLFALLVGTTSTGDGVWTITRGSNLGAATSTGSCELVMSRALASALHAGPGSPATLNVEQGGARSALPPVTCGIVGIGDFAFAGTGGFAVGTSLESLAAAMARRGPVDAQLVLVSTRPAAAPGAAAKAIAALRPDLHVYSNEEVVEQFNRNGFAYFQQISLVLSSLTMVFAFMLVATLLTVSINQRLGEIAALRALGIGRRRIASMLLWESVLLVGVGGVLALPLGGALALVLDRILRQMPGLPDRIHFFVFEPRAVAVHVALLTITAFAAAAYPVWLTSRLPIAATLRREVMS